MKPDFKVYDENTGLSACCAGLNGQRLCQHYRKGKKVMPTVFMCMWFDRDTHDCLKNRLTANH